jgi:alpha-L-fucosidase 2
MLMKKVHALFVSGLLGCCLYTGAQENPLTLWYRQPAVKWTAALPIGNGRIGAMIYGGVAEEHLQFNESTLWTGRPRQYERPGAVQYLQPIRQLLAEGKQQEAETLADAHFMGRKDPDDSLYILNQKRWLQQVHSNIQPAAPATSDAGWKTMHLPVVNGWETAGLEGIDGAVWFRTNFEFPAKWKGKNMVVALGRIRDLDYTYVNGTFIGTGEGISNKRVYTIPATALQVGNNVLAVQVINFYDKGGFTGVKSKQPFFVVYPEGGDAEQGIPLSADWKYMIQNEAPPAYPQFEASYQPFGDVFFTIDGQQNFTDYKRELDLATAISKVSYTVNNTRYEREYFASAPQQVIAMRMHADRAGAISLTASLRSAHKNYIVTQVDARTIALQVRVKNGVLKGAAYLYVQTEKGSVSIVENKIRVQGADEAIFYLTAATSFRNYKDVTGDPVLLCRQTLLQLKNARYTTVKTKHISDYSKYFNTFSINLGTTAQTALPTDQRIKLFDVIKDPALLSLYMQYGRYLLLSSSRPGGQPANLQGLWNDLLTPPWGSKYTTNINLQMNYWPAEMLGLSDCTQPLFRMMEDLRASGSKTAMAHYGAPGWVLHHNTDLWRGTAPINSATHGIWVTGAAWLCHHIWEHYLYTQDTAFLRRYYPVMKDAALFFTGFLVKDQKTGWLISTPSNSPEQGGLVAGPAMDHQIIRDVFKNSIAAAEILKTDVASRAHWQEQYRQLAPNQVGRYGQLQEWLKDIDDTSNTHRHVSHLWGVYPGSDITWQTPALMNAARQSLLYRGDDGTGWSIAWKVNLWARFKDGDHALRMLGKLLTPAENAQGAEQGGVYSNLFDAHPPFQIDGNFGGAAGLAELLIQSHDDYIEVLPALPAALSSGSVKGIRVRGGFIADLSWEQGKLKELTLTSVAGNEIRLKYGQQQKNFSTKKGKTYKLNSLLICVNIL